MRNYSLFYSVLLVFFILCFLLDFRRIIFIIGWILLIFFCLDENESTTRKERDWSVKVHSKIDFVRNLGCGCTPQQFKSSPSEKCNKFDEKFVVITFLFYYLS